MPQIVLMSVIGLGAATAFGYAGGAAMETDIGRALLGALAAVLAVVTIAETMRMMQLSRRI